MYMSKKLTTEEFIEKVRKIHGDNYEYPEKYINSTTKMKIICPFHGVFFQTPNKHLQGQKCKYCSKSLHIRDYINQVNNIHNNYYLYNNINYINTKTDIIVTCPKHGDFIINANHHLKGYGCPLCNKGSYLTTKTFIIKALEIYGDSFSYEKTNYINNKTKMTVTCSKHGDFQVTPYNFFKGHTCIKCHFEKKFDNDYFLEKARLKHNDLYDYPEKYINSITKIKIICKKHGAFYQKPNDHLQGHGCPICKNSKGEQNVRKFLLEKNINFKQQKKFKDCKDKKELPFDFYLPDYNLCVEYDGIQHFKEKDFFGGKKGLKKIQKHDKIKNQHCYKNNIGLLRIKYDDNVIEKLNFYFSSIL